MIVVGTGLAGASAAATLAGQGYTVEAFCFQDSARRAHSIAAQGGINATKDYANEGDSVQRLFVDTMKGGDFRAREANVWRLAETSTNIIDQAVAQGVPFNREYGGMLATRSFGGVLVERTFYCRGQTGQQLLLGAYSALQRQVAEGRATVHNRHELLDVVLVDGQARGIIARNLITGEIERHAADAVVLATGGYCNVYFLSTNAMGCNVTAAWRAHRRGAAFANPCFTQIHPTSIPATGHYQSKLTLMSESLRNDGRVWVPRDPAEVREPAEIPDVERYYYLEERYPRFGNLVPRDVASRAAKIVCDDGLGVGGTGRAVYLDFRDAISERGADVIADRYGNLFEMYERITGDSPWKTPMMIYPAPHYSMGGLWVDYELQSTIPGLFAIGEANFSDHGANRLGASAMMQCLADGYFIAPHTVTNFVSGVSEHVSTDDPAFESTEQDVRARSTGLWVSAARRRPRSSIASSATSCSTIAGSPARPTASVKLWAGSRAPRGVLDRPSDRAGRGGHQPDARVRGADRRLPRARRAHVPRRAGPRGVLRLPPARGAPDRRGRSYARRRRACQCAGVGVEGRGRRARDAARRARVRIDRASNQELQVRFAR